MHFTKVSCNDTLFCFHVVMMLRMTSIILVPFSLRSVPNIFRWTIGSRSFCSAKLFVGSIFGFKTRVHQ